MMDFNYMINLIVITLLLAVFLLIIYYCYKGELEEGNRIIEDEFTIGRLTKEIQETFHQIINLNIADLGLNEEETKKRERQKHRLNMALRYCSYGDEGEKEFVKDYIKDLLQRYLRVKEDTINRVIFFHDEDRLSIQDKFEILFFCYKKQYGNQGFEKFIQVHEISLEKVYEDGIYYEINQMDIEKAYRQCSISLSYMDQLELVTQRIYQNFKGLGVIDELRDHGCLDGVSGGVNGITNGDYNYMEEIVSQERGGNYKYDSVWIFWRGKSIHLSFLTFGSKKELERICKNIYRYDAPYYLSGMKGKIITEDKSGNRITVARPPFSDDWKFFVRKFDSGKHLNMEQLIHDENSQLVIAILRYIMASTMTVVITGNQGVGKTTILKALIQYINPTYNIRVQEDVFETWLNRVYGRRNISSFRKTDTISMEEGMDFTKKTDGDVMILGEVSEQRVASLLIQLTQFTKQTICTNHASSTEKLVEYFRNALLSANIFQDEKIAEEQVVSGIQWDIHMAKDHLGHRYIERITEILPYKGNEYDGENTMKENMMIFFQKMTNKKVYETKDILQYRNGSYVVTNQLSEFAIEKIMKNLLPHEVNPFMNFYQQEYLNQLTGDGGVV